jgi:hypothetical protein
MAEKGALYLVIEGKEVVHFPEKNDAIKKNFDEVIRYEEKGMEEIIVYKRVH